MRKIILASASPRRRELLKMLKIEFEVLTDNTPENAEGAKSPEEAVVMLAARKCENVAARIPEGTEALVIAADTVVSQNGAVIGKPKDESDAFRILTALGGTAHSVYTGVCVKDLKAGKETRFFEKTDVVFRDLSDDEIRAYIASGEPMDKAGAYGIQGLGSVFVKEIHGDYFNVVGLPLCRLCEVLKSEYGMKALN